MHSNTPTAACSDSLRHEQSTIQVHSCTRHGYEKRCQSAAFVEWAYDMFDTVCHACVNLPRCRPQADLRLRVQWSHGVLTCMCVEDGNG